MVILIIAIIVIIVIIATIAIISGLIFIEFNSTIVILSNLQTILQYSFSYLRDKYGCHDCCIIQRAPQNAILEVETLGKQRVVRTDSLITQ